MRGQGFEIMSWIAIILAIVFLIIFDVLMWFSLSYEIDSNLKLRTAIWVANRLSGDTSCLADGTASPHKNILDKQKISIAEGSYASSSEHACAQIFCSAYAVEIRDFKNSQTYSFGDAGDDKEKESYLLPVLIKDGNRLDPAMMSVSVGFVNDDACKLAAFSDAERVLGPKACDYLDIEVDVPPGASEDDIASLYENTCGGAGA